MTNIEVKTRVKQYQIKIMIDSLHHLGTLVTKVWCARQVAVVTDTNVGPYYAKLVTDELTAAGFKMRVMTVPAGDLYARYCLDSSTDIIISASR